MLWGDSFAAHYAPGIVKNKDSINANVIQYTSAGCPPILSYYSYKIPLCSQFNAHALDLIKDYRIKTVVLGSGPIKGIERSRCRGVRGEVA